MNQFRCEMEDWLVRRGGFALTHKRQMTGAPPKRSRLQRPTFLVEIEFPVFGLLLRLGFVRLLVDGVEHRLRDFRLPAF